MEFDESEANPSDVIDQRGQSTGGGGGIGGLGGLVGGGGSLGGVGGGILASVLGGLLSGRRGRAGGGVGLLALVAVGFLVVRSLAAGGFDIGSTRNLNRIPSLPGASTDQPVGSGNAADVANDPQAADVKFANFVITDANNVWAEQVKNYQRTKLVLYSNAVDTGCGAATKDAGPFYCPADSLVYLDLSFWSELQSKYGGGGDFAEAYVIAHEVGHHVQKELGITDEVERAERQNPDQVKGADGLSVRVELQADCLAGVWAHTQYAKGSLQTGDVEEAINAATAVGDDSIQRSAVGRVQPDTFTHGTSTQRVKWFRTGFDSGSSDHCDTFSVDSLG